jgi:hypothetical protein
MDFPPNACSLCGKTLSRDPSAQFREICPHSYAIWVKVLKSDEKVSVGKWARSIFFLPFLLKMCLLLDISSSIVLSPGTFAIQPPPTH